jgi:hypothetical protein
MCCKEPLCLQHAHCTRHAQHPTLWKVIDTDAYAGALPGVTELRDGIIRELEAELAREEQQAAAAATAAAAASSTGGTWVAQRAAGAAASVGAGGRSTAGSLLAAAPAAVRGSRGGSYAAAPGEFTFETVRRRAKRSAAEAAAAATRSGIRGAEGGGGFAADEDVGDDGDGGGGGSSPPTSFAQETAGERRQGEPELVWRLPGAASVSGSGAPEANDTRSPTSALAARGGSVAALRGEPAEAVASAARVGMDSGLAAGPAPVLTGPAAGVRATVVELLTKALQHGTGTDLRTAAFTEYIEPTPARTGAAATDASAAASAADSADGDAGLTAFLARKAAQELADTLSLTPSGALAVAGQVEASLWEACGGATANEDYRVTASSLAHNLRAPRSTHLRLQLLGGRLGPGQLVEAALRSPEELLDPEARRSLAAARSAAAAIVGGSDGYMPATFRCPACGGRDTEYRLQDAAQSRKAETWGQGGDAAGGVGVRCRECGNVWTRDSL